MLLRNKKIHDVNQGKWIGVGGKFLPGETPDECLLREVKEETGYELTDYRYRGRVIFQSDGWETEEMYLYTATGFRNSQPNMLVPLCDEGTFRWVKIEEVETLNLWEGDRIFLRRIARGEDDINLVLRYRGDELVEVNEVQE